MKKLIFVLCLLVSTFASNAQSIDTDMKKFFEVSGTEASFKNIISLMMDNFKNTPAFASIPSEFWDDFSKEAQLSYQELQVELGEIYKKHFTSEEIKQFIAFYESPIGKKFVQEQPLIQSESYMISSEWGKKLGEKVVRKIQEKKD